MFFEKILDELGYPGLITEWTRNLDGAAYNEHSEKRQNKPTRKKINCYFSRDHWVESIKQDFMWFLFQDVLSFTAKNIPEYSDHKLLQSMLEGFFVQSLISIWQWWGDKRLSSVKWMQHNCYFPIFWNIKYGNTSSFIKSVVFRNVGLLWIIEITEQYKFAVYEYYF